MHWTSHRRKAPQEKSLFFNWAAIKTLFPWVGWCFWSRKPSDQIKESGSTLDLPFQGDWNERQKACEIQGLKMRFLSLSAHIYLTVNKLNFLGEEWEKKTSVRRIFLLFWTPEKNWWCGWNYLALLVLRTQIMTWVKLRSILWAPSGVRLVQKIPSKRKVSRVWRAVLWEREQGFVPENPRMLESRSQHPEKGN